MKTIDYVSVIVPVHNGERHIGRCIRSLMAQNTAIKFEILVIDDGSTDLTAYALSQFGNAIRLLSHPENIGLPAALNTGIEASKGDFVVRVDADDYVNAFFIQFLVEFLSYSTKYDAVACDYLLVDETEKVMKVCSSVEEPIGCGILLDKSHVQSVGGYDDAFLANEEREFRIRYEQRFSIGRLEVPLYRYRRHDSNLTNDEKLMAHFNEQLRKRHDE